MELPWLKNKYWRSNVLATQDGRFPITFKGVVMKIVMDFCYSNYATNHAVNKLVNKSTQQAGTEPALL